jgi:hypothetical protein
MIQTGLLATGVLIVGLSVPAMASTTQGWSHFQSLSPSSTEQREAAGGDFAQPPAPDIDPGMAVAPPSHAGSIRIVPPPGTADGPKNIEPK